MRSEANGDLPVIEWSLSGAVAYDPVRKATVCGANLRELAAALSGRQAVFAVARKSCFVKEVPVPMGSSEDVKRAVAFSIGQHLPLSPEEASFDLRLTHDIGPKGATGTLAAIRTSDLRHLHEQAREAGIEPVAVLPAAFGSVLVAQGLGLKSCAVVSESLEGVAIDLVAGGELRYSRSVAAGRASALEQELDMAFAAAALPCSPPVAAGIAAEPVDYRLETSPLQALAEAWQRVGLNLELPEHAAARSKRGRLWRLRLAVASWVAAVAIAGLVALSRVNADAQRNEASRQMAAALRTTRARQIALQTQLSRITVANAALDQAFDPAQRMSDVIATVSNAVPQNVWLTGANFERGSSFVLRGTALSSEDVAKYLQTLSADERFRDVKLLFANNARIENTPVIQFSISAFPVGNLPISARSTGRVGR